MTDLLLTEVADGVATVTLNRPEARNALSSELLRLLPQAMAALEADDAVGVVILTGADPAFSAGLDLRELGATGDNLTGAGDGAFKGPRFWPPMTKTVIGAVNGPAVTGGFEMALQCDFLVASDRARFGDTHARVGVIPGGGMSVLLPQAIGVRKAMQISLTGRFLDAREALDWGLVTHVVPHDELLPFTRGLAADIVANDPTAVALLLDEYKQAALTTVGEGWAMETANFRAFRTNGFDPAKVAARREAVIEKGRAQSS